MTIYFMQTQIVRISFITCDHHTPNFSTDVLAFKQFSKAISTPAYVGCKTLPFEGLTVMLLKTQGFGGIPLSQHYFPALQRIIVP
jgi:hypothetical protein